MKIILSFSCLCMIYTFPENGYSEKISNVVSNMSRCIFGVYDYGVSTRDRVIIVELHNEYRELITKNLVPNQPRGVDLMKIKYDTNLAILAQRSADKCHYAYDNYYHDDLPIGQNLFMTMSGSFEDKPNWTEAVQSWFSQHDFYLFGGQIEPKNRHYVQLIWAKTTRIGCGYVAFPLKRGHFMYYKYYICNYSPGIIETELYPYKIETSMPNTPCYDLCN